MGKEKILEKLETIYKDRMTLMNHIVRAYFPGDRVEKVFVKPESKFKCVITGNRLSSVNDVVSGLEDEPKNQFFQNVEACISNGHKLTEETMNIMGNELLAVQGGRTDTFMSIDTYEVFYSWVIEKYTSGDKHFRWLLKDVNRGKFLPRKPKTDKKDKKLTDGRATFSLGDLASLQELKKKMSK